MTSFKIVVSKVQDFGNFELSPMETAYHANFMQPLIMLIFALRSVIQEKCRKY